MANENESNPAQTNLDEVLDDDVTEDGAENPDETNEASGQEGEAGNNPPAKDGQDGNPNQPQSRSQNAEYARRRREAEAAQAAERERLRQQAFNEGKIAGIGGVNPFTKQPIEDEEDLHLYDLMKKANDEGLNPVEELPRLLREEKAKRKAEEAEQAKKTQAEEAAKQADVQRLKAGFERLAKVHPECTTDWVRDQMGKNPKFKSYILDGYSPLEAYSLCGYSETKSEEEKPQREPTPSSGQGGSASRKSVKDMTDDEYEEYAREVHGGF